MGQAMLKLLPSALADEDAAVSIEVYDDVAFHREGRSPKEVLQINHSVESDRELLDTSRKTWRTLAIWAEEWLALDADQERQMTLITTQRAKEGSALAALRPDVRKHDHAASALAAIAADPEGAAGTTSDRAVFEALGAEVQRALISRVTVIDGSPQAVEVRSELERRLMGAHEARFIPALADGVEGWWWSRVVRALYDHQPIPASEMRTVIDEWRRSLSDTSLPILAFDELGDEDRPVVEYQSAAFIGCLRDIDASDADVDRAIDNFLQASAHRSYWMRRLLVGPNELQLYDDSLLTEWDMRCDRVLDRLGLDTESAARIAAGKELYRELQLDVVAPLRAELTDRFVQRGSLHGLADNERLAWHPDAVQPFRDALRRRSAA